MKPIEIWIGITTAVSSDGYSENMIVRIHTERRLVEIAMECQAEGIDQYLTKIDSNGDKGYQVHCSILGPFPIQYNYAEEYFLEWDKNPDYEILPENDKLLIFLNSALKIGS